MYLDEIKRGLRGEIKKRENEQYCTCETNIRQMCKDVLTKIEEQESVIADKDKELRHHKYKRCLAMAKWCDEAYHRECGLNPEEMTDKEFYKQQIEFWPRWSSRWLAIAKRFKTNSTAQHGKG